MAESLKSKSNVPGVLILLLWFSLQLGLTRDLEAQTLFVAKESGLITFEMVLTIDSMKADPLFDKTKGWFVEYFREANQVIRGEVKPSMIKGTYLTEYAAAMGTKQQYENDIVVRMKDGAVKVTINNLRTVGTSGMAIETIALKDDGTMRTGGMYQKTFKDIESKCQALCASLAAYVKKKSEW